MRTQSAWAFDIWVANNVEWGRYQRKEDAMHRNMFRSKIHRATVTDASLDYEGSVTIDSVLMEAAEILPYEAVHIWNVTTGTRLVTYALPAPYGSGVICVNGAAAHLNRPGELVILATFCDLTVEEARSFRPRIVFVDANNRITSADTAPDHRAYA
jgi:aspartate 1-decarboxylase